MSGDIVSTKGQRPDHRFVATQRARGMSWAAIAGLMGCALKAAHQRYGGAENIGRGGEVWARHAPEARALLLASKRRRGGARPLLTNNEMDLILEARADWQTRPGYTHLHPVVHFDARIPMLISLGADGTIGELRERLVDYKKNSPGPTWMRIAWQLSEAMTFLFDTAKLAHVDIRPKHVLFVRHGGQQRLHCWLSDYSALCPADDVAAYDYDEQDGAYAPMHSNNEAGASHREQSLFAYYATLMDLFLFEMIGGHETYITNTGHSVSEFLSLDSNLLLVMECLHHNAQHPIAQMVLRPLRSLALSELNAHFYDEMRPWLQKTLQAGLCPTI